MRAIRAAIGATTTNPELLTCAERLQNDSYLRREDANLRIRKLSSDAVPIKEIVRQTGYSRGTVHQIVRGHRTDVFRVRQSSLEAYLPLLDELWRQLKCKGFGGCSRVVGEWAARRRRSERVCDQQPQKVPSTRTIAWLMTTARDELSKADTITIAAIEAGVPALIEARNLIDRFQTMIRPKAKTEHQWIAKACDSLFAPFANGILKDKAAVSAWSNGQVEGQINKLKLVKRQMYGRAKLSLIEARLIGAI
jgi:transposase